MALQHPLTRRALVATAAASLALPGSAWAQAKAPLVGPLAPNPAEFQRQVAQFMGSATAHTEGLHLEVPVLADNPSAVPVKV